MEPNYTYVNSPDYIDSLSFDYVETYSFQRGEQYEQNLKLLEAEYKKRKTCKEHDRNLTDGEELRYAELYQLVGFTQYLIDERGRFHPSSQKINTYLNNHPMVTRLVEILRTEVIEVPMWLCAPVYRDAVVFYDHNNMVVSVLNVCLSCQYMETKRFQHVNGDYKTYELLKSLFIDIGHEVEKQMQ